MADEDPDATLRGRDLLGLGGILVGAVVGGMLIGLLVDDHAGTSPTGVLVGVAVGVVLGCAAFVARVRAALRGR
ncbi:MAG: AtpZ/AtpI family protein [Marmoricola sp.]